MTPNHACSEPAIALWLPSPRPSGRRKFQLMLLVVLVSLPFTGCARFPKPSVMLENTNTLTIRYSDSNYRLGRFKDHLIVEASINGVSGPFVVDTGAPIPIMHMNAARRCGLMVSSNHVETGDFWGERVGLKEATNVTVQLAPGFLVHWPKVLIYPGDHETFGILDYGTLKAAHAVIDTKRKTITVTR